MDIGVDIAVISRFENKSDAFIKKFLTAEEFEVYNGFGSTTRKAEYAAGRWAAKEAVYKATGEKDFLKLSVLSDKSGKPFVSGRPELRISISHDGGTVIAAALNIKEQ